MHVAVCGGDIIDVGNVGEVCLICRWWFSTSLLLQKLAGLLGILVIIVLGEESEMALSSSNRI